MQRPAPILMVEDERIIAFDLRTRLTWIGHTVVGAVALGTGGDGSGGGPATGSGADGHPLARADGWH
jgi:hypothetical protein